MPIEVESIKKEVNNINKPITYAENELSSKFYQGLI